MDLFHQVNSRVSAFFFRGLPFGFAREFDLVGDLTDLMQHFGAGAGVLGALPGNHFRSRVARRGPGPDPGAIDHGICHLDLTYHCGLLAKEISGFVGQKGIAYLLGVYWLSFRGDSVERFDLVDRDGLLTKKEFLADLFGVYWLRFDSVDYDDLLTKKEF
ncbi:hypothetical protein Taro_005154 [Colocasia esculenta]|uniref:Uncharacterized protein n=1 Tax=Colocasia esculenta TaxID=4460 RepID=A0A843TTM5_COLES|nr:hypothetical protein [Colocasia esculenta]